MKELAKRLSTMVNRRSFLGKGAAATAALVAAVFGISRSTHACGVGCCSLCRHDCPGGYTCYWVWYCCSGENEWSCFEGYIPLQSCGPDCEGNVCSYASMIGYCDNPC